VRGDQLGRKIGFPTANLEITEERKLIPKPGVYAVKVFVDGVSYKGMLSIGYRPTISDSEELRIEVHLIDFSADLYDRKIRVDLYAYTRDQVKFDGLESLRNQIENDKLEILKLLEKA
jgi:riboflavin kinase/FMN adenylyltransferase